MPLALIMSSHVAGSRVGGSAQALALSQFKIDPVVVPTVLYGRHPGWGAPGGAQVPVEAFEGMLDGIEANGLFGLTDLVITGYFATPAQVKAATRAIDAVRAAPRGDAFNRKPLIVVDPVMGDAGKGLFVPAEVADAIQEELLPKADLITPNSWELQRITGTDARSPDAAVRAARLTGKAVLVSSVMRGGEIGVVYADKKEAWLAAHQKGEFTPPSGTGDLLAALFAAALLEGQTPSYGLARAVGGLSETITSAAIWSAPELPIVAMGARIKQASPTVRLERLA
ncbi:pyridoxal kinase [Caulobacter mirabilis]|uniref:pyridoxal kinase n=1 Tax=Caulobacter mirabilis TaxID=69666 RepID=A0A2D2B2G4_9CAUL|nr:PfkB family carbohydrate kinase [Caulobacter mirabilis]ATQ44418.1 pyridoxine kinase [Caulobacter mirabilis]